MDFCEKTNLIGNWMLESESNFQEFLVALGVNYFMRKGSLLVKVFHIEINNEGNSKWSFKVKNKFINTQSIFQLNEELDEVTADGRAIKSIWLFDGPNKLINEQRDPKSRELQCVCVRELIDGKLVETLSANGVVSVRTYTRCNN